ncbi:MAG: putative Phosphate-selective porin [Nitrospira sp.]|nr:putative Phosphate-selective porin [Nitrospira sp.]
MQIFRAIVGDRTFSATVMLSLVIVTGASIPDSSAQESPITDKVAAQTGLATPPGAPPAPSGIIRRGEKGLESTSLEDLMLEKGLISMDDWIRIKAEEEQRLNERSVAAEFTGSPRWFERITMYGYGMMRYNNTSNGAFRSYHDASIGDKNNGAQPGFFFRRIRWVITGQVSDHVSFFIQPDMASNISGNTHALSMRDAWGEWNFDRDREYRLRVGLQRVPCSWDNWQASRQRMAIDRADGTNSCAASERDMGVSFMWSPKIAQQRFKQMLDYMYGPGDYGVFHIQVYNGQGLNAQEANADKHVAMRLAWPFELPGGRLLEVGANAMHGQFVVNHGTAAAGQTLFSFNQSGSTGARSYRDERMNFYVYYPPQPFGFIAEYTVGRTPERQANGRVADSALSGGYVQAHYQWKYSDIGLANLYSRYQEYRGGIKFQTGAPSGKMSEWETGIAWQPDPQWEFTVAYAFAQRMNLFLTDPGSATVPGVQKEQYANLLRFQAIWFWN